MTDTDPLDEGVPRNGRGAPLIVPLKRGKPDLKTKLVPYVRASTFCKALDDGGGLATWQIRHAVLGVAQSPDLVAMAGALGRDLNDFTREDKANLDALIATAHDRSGGNAKANYGTAVHSLTEDDPLDDTARERHANAQMQADVDSYNTALSEAGLTVAATEVFVVNDDLTVAGTFDHSYLLGRDLTVTVGERTTHLEAGQIVLGDKKTGTLHLGSHAIQLAIYARGKLYDPATGERSALDVSPQWGVVAHIERGKAHTVLYLVDLAAGWRAAKLAGEVRAFRSAAGQRALGAAFVDVAGTPVDPAPAINPAPVAEVLSLPVVTDDRMPDDAVAIVNDGTIAAVVKVEPDVVDVDPTEQAAQFVETTIGATRVDDPILAAINTAGDADTCRALWGEHRATWQPEHTEAVKARLAALQAAA